jgi:hypothetical protein
MKTLEQKLEDEAFNLAHADELIDETLVVVQAYLEGHLSTNGLSALIDDLEQAQMARQGR